MYVRSPSRCVAPYRGAGALRYAFAIAPATQGPSSGPRVGAAATYREDHSTLRPFGTALLKLRLLRDRPGRRVGTLVPYRDAALRYDPRYAQIYSGTGPIVPRETIYYFIKLNFVPRGTFFSIFLFGPRVGAISTHRKAEILYTPALRYGSAKAPPTQGPVLSWDRAGRRVGTQ